MKTFLTTTLVLAAFLTLGTSQSAQANIYYHGSAGYAPYHAYQASSCGCRNECDTCCNRGWFW